MYSLEILNKFSRIQKQSIVLLNDLLMSFFSTWFAFSLRLDIFHIPHGNQIFVYCLTISIFIPFFIKFGLYQAIFRYSSLATLKPIFLSSMSYGLLLFVILFFLKLQSVPRSIGILQPILFFILVSGSRYLFVAIIYRMNLKKNELRILIYGAGESGAQTALSMTSSFYNIVAFIDDDSFKDGKKLNNIKIFNSTNISKLINSKNITDILIAIPSLGLNEKRKLISKLQKYNLKVRSLPEIKDIISGSVSISDFKELEIEDLLEREVSESILELNNIENKSVLVCGAGGSIGSELCRQLIYLKPEKIILLDNSEINLYNIEEELKRIININKIETKVFSNLASIRNKERILNIFEEFNPFFVFHTAAYKHVPIVENNSVEAISNNVFGTLNLLESSHKFNVKNFLFVSTDKAVRPTNIMGASKRLAEMCVQAYADKSEKKSDTIYSIVRFGNVLNSSGSVTKLFNKQIKEGGPITITHENVTRFFMTISEAVTLILHAGNLAQGGEVFVLDMGKPIKIINLAKKMIKLSGLKVKNNKEPQGDIELKIIGLRPGEKLYEELIIGKNSEPTKNKDIMMAKEEYLKWFELEAILDNLNEVVKLNDKKLIIQILNNSISGFDHKPNN